MRITSAGFAPPANRKLGAEHRTVAIAEFIASLSLAVSILVVVSVSVARADVVSGVIDNEGGVFAIALLLGLLFIGMGGVTIVSLPTRHVTEKRTARQPYRNCRSCRTVDRGGQGDRHAACRGVDCLPPDHAWSATQDDKRSRLETDPKRHGST